VDTDHFGTHTKYGTEGDGVFTLIGGALFAVFFLLHHAPWQRAVATLIALGLVAIAVLDFSDIQNHVENTNAEAEAVSAELTASVGVGLWMVLVGSVGVLAGVLLRRSTRSRTSPQRLPFLKPPRSPKAEVDSRRDRPA
jgi:drug/metabolite transporter (DMT)-like permease